MKRSPILLTLLLIGSLSANNATALDKFEWVTKPGEILLMSEGRPAIQTMTAYDPSTKEARETTYKVYTHVYGPGTNDLITKGPGGLYPHHRGIYIGWNKTHVGDKTFDFWHCNKGEHLRLVGEPKLAVDGNEATCTLTIHWNDSEGKPVIIEQRTLVVTEPRENTRQIDVTSKLESQRGLIKLEGDRQHAGLQFRAPQSIAESKGARYIRPAGFPEQPEAFEVDDKEPLRHINLHWLEMTYKVGNESYNVEYLEAPGQPAPSLFSERPYGRFGAFFKATVDTGKPLTVRYRFLISRGQTPTREEVQRDYDRYAKEIAIKGK